MTLSRILLYSLKRNGKEVEAEVSWLSGLLHVSAYDHL
jgi:hypothetical protein